MIIDTSAIIAIANREESASRVLDALASAPNRRMSAGNLLELFIVVDNTTSPRMAWEAEELLNDAEVTFEPVTAEQVSIARRAYRDYGKGSHSARLDFGDCFAYSLAKMKREPLLFVGNDFSQTDIDPAIA